MSDYESNIKINVDDSELSDAEKRINNLKDKKVDVGFKVDNSGISKTSDGLKQVEQSAKGSGKAVDGLGQSMGNVSKNTLAAVASYKVFNATIKQLKDAVSEVEALNGALTKVHMTMQDISNADLGSLKSQILDMSNELSTYVDTVSDAAEIYANANESISTIMQKAEPTVLLASATKKSASETADTIQGILNQFKMTDDAAMGVVDTLEGLSAEMNMDFAKGIQNVSEAVKVSGSVIDSAGMSFERYASIVSATAESTRLSGSVLGNAFKTISSRIGRSKDGETTNAEKANSEKALNSIGISIRDTTGDIQDLDITLESLSKVWGNLNRSQQNYIAEQSAGVRQISIFKNMMDNYSRAMELEEKALNSSGTAMKVNETRAESIDGKMQKLSSTMSKMYNDAVSENVIMNVLDLANGIARVADKLGLLQGAFAALGTAGIAKGIGLISSNWEKLLSVFKSPVTKLSAGVGIATSVAIKGFELLDDKFTLTFATAQKHMEESASVYESNYSELQSINSELETTSSRIAELKSQGTLTIAEEAELAKLERQNSLLEAQQKLKQSATDAAQKQAAADAATSINFKSEKSTQTRTDKNGMDMEVSIDRKEYVREQVALMEEAQRQIDQATEKINSGDKSKKWEEQLKTASDNLNTYKENATNTLSDLNSEAENLYDESTGNVIKGYEGLVNEIDSLNNLVNNFDLSGIEKNQAAIESFFDGSTKSNSIKEKLLEAVESGESATDALHAMGITLNDLGITGEDKKAVFDDYFSGLIESAQEAEEAINSIDGSVEGVKTALDSENQNADWSSMAEAADTVAELYKNGQVGTDDFKAFTQFMSKDIINPDADGIKYDADAYVEAYKAATDKIKRYFDSENPLQSVANFSNDLVNNGLATQVGDDLTWSFKSSAEAADKLGLSVDAVEVLMHNLEAYGAEFDEVMWSGEGLERYQSALEKIKTLYDSIEDEDSKERLKNIIDQSELDDFENNLENLTEDQIIKIEFEYDLATIQQQIDELQKQVNTTGGTTEEWGSLNASKMSYRNKLASDSSMAGAIDDGGYKDSVSEFENLSQKLKTEYKELGEDGRREIQQQQSALLDFQNAYLDMFSSGEVASWEEFLGSDNLESVLEKISEDSGIAKEELENLFNIDLSSLDEPKHIKLEGEFDPGEIEAQLDELSAGSTITFNADVDGVESEVQVLKNEDGTLTYSANIEGVQTQLLPMLNQDGTVTYIKVGQEEASDSEAGVGYKKTSQEAPSDKTAGVWYKIKGVIGNISNFLTGGGGISGTAYSGGGSKLDKAVHGKAYLNGTLDDNSWLKDDWKTQKDNIALTGEVGQEIVVDPKTNTWRTVGDNGAEFTEIPKGSIVFNSKQTKDLLSKGHVNSRGRAFASGTAYANGFRVPSTSSTNSSTSTTTASTPSSSTKATQATQANTDATKENTEAQKETIDWIETLVDTQKSENERLSNAIENFEMHFNQNSAIDAYIKDSQAYMNTLRNAQNAYMSKANALGLDGTYVHKIWSGELSIEDIADEDLADKIKKYQDWYNQAKDLGDQLTEINTKIRESKINKLDNIKDDYDNLVDYAKSIADYNEAINDLYEARNLVGLEDPMMQVVNQQNAIRQALLNEEKELNDQLNALVADGTIAEYSDTWLKWKTEINGDQL